MFIRQFLGSPLPMSNAGICAVTVLFAINQHCFYFSFASDYGVVGSFVYVHGVNRPLQVISKEKSQDYEQKVMMC